MEMKSLTPPPSTSKAKLSTATPFLSTDHLIIGKGLFGSAAARHLASSGQRVMLVGPDEPAQWSTHTAVFASHYDQARIVSQSAPDAAWQQLDQASIAAYDEIERESGIRFFTPSGRLTAVPNDLPIFYPYLSKNAPQSHQLTPSQAAADYAYHLPSHYTAVFEDAPSGHLNPRAMVQAQIKAAQKQGVLVVSALVTQVETSDGQVKATLADGRTITADRVLIATGAFANCFGLLARKLAIRAEAISSILCEVSTETAVQHAHLPPLNVLHTDGPLTHISILPPLPYPDGRFYIKVVPISPNDKLLPDFDALSNWFRQPPPYPYLEEVKRLMAHLLPQIEVYSWRHQPCVAAYTPSFKPMIDCLVDGRVYVAIGGNSGAAHPSDAIGKLAADLMQHNQWQSSLDLSLFQLQFAVDHEAWMSDPRSVWQMAAERKTV